MKKKNLVIAATLAGTLVFANTGYAASVTKKITAIFGSHVIKKNKVDQKIQTLAYGSNVYIPVSKITSLTGATVAKSGNVYNITPVKKEDGITRANINVLKYYGEVQDLYDALDELGERLIDNDDQIFIAYTYYRDEDHRDEDPSNNEYLNNIIHELGKNTETLNHNIYYVESVLADGKKLGKYTADDQSRLNQILNCLSDAIDGYQSAVENLYLYVTSGSNEGEDRLISDLDGAYKKSSDAQDLSSKGYSKYFDLIQNY